MVEGVNVWSGGAATTHFMDEVALVRHAKYLLAVAALIGADLAQAQYALQDAFPALPSFSLPVEVTQPPDGSNRLFVVEQRGRIYVFENSGAVSGRRLFLDLTDIVSASGGETGLLGLAFHPSYSSNGYFFVSYTSSRSGSLKSYLSRFNVSGSDPDSAVVASEVVLLSVDQPYANHNGGKIAFGPAGYLYMALGDGGSANDPLNNGQSLTTLLGKILRLDVDTPSPPRAYGIPPGNPFAGNTLGVREEIWAYGLRNPWKFSFDLGTGTLWAGDVGQGAREEIDTIVAGGNYGWRLMEGTLCTPGVNPSCQDTAGLLRPVWEYDRSAGDVSVTGGYVYRGLSIPDLHGRYVYGDFASGRIWALSTGEAGPAVNELLLDSPYQISSFGVDREGELYALSYGSPGRLYRLIETATSAEADVLPVVFGLEQNYPNPFNPRTDIVYYVAGPGPVRLTVYDLLGREVAVLVDGALSPGTHSVAWDATTFPSGIYVYRLTSGKLVEARRMVLLK